MMRIILIGALALPFICFGQADTLVNIHLTSGQRTIVAGSRSAGGTTTPSNRGRLPLNVLPTELPEVNLFEGAQFTVPALADLSMDVLGFPASSTVQLVMYRDEKAVGRCTGTMVAPDLVLTAAHCLIGQSSTVPDYEEISARAGGGLGIGFLVSYARSAYLLKRHLDNKPYADMMLLELEEPIGDHTGWTGITTEVDYSNTLFHKFSFPAKALEGPLTNSGGRRLHYNFGRIGQISENFIGIPNSRSANATPGQSGSAFLLIRSDSAFAVGVSVYSRMYQHQRMTKNIFNAFRPIIEESVRNRNTIPYTLSPKVIRESAVLHVGLRINRFTLAILNPAGEVIKTQRGAGGIIIIERADFAPGEYNFRIMDDSGRFARGAFRVEQP